MEILKRGTGHLPKQYIIDCYNCDSKLKFNETEVRNEYSQDRDHIGYSIECPVCTREITFRFLPKACES